MMMMIMSLFGIKNIRNRVYMFNVFHFSYPDNVFIYNMFIIIDDVENSKQKQKQKICFHISFFGSIFFAYPNGWLEIKILV